MRGRFIQLISLVHYTHWLRSVGYITVNIVIYFSKSSPLELLLVSLIVNTFNFVATVISGQVDPPNLALLAPKDRSVAPSLSYFMSPNLKSLNMSSIDHPVPNSKFKMLYTL